MFGCGACIPEEPRKARDLGLAPTAQLVDESHFRVSIRVCPACGQSFVWIFAEEIDWANGEDPQHVAVMPLTAREAARQTAAVDLEEIAALARRRRFLLDDWPADGPRTCIYTTGAILGPHD